MNRRKWLFAVVGPILSVALFFTTVELATRLISWATGSGFALALHELDADDTGVESIYCWHLAPAVLACLKAPAPAPEMQER